MPANFNTTRAETGQAMMPAATSSATPSPARNETQCADDVTGQTSDCRCATKARVTARLLRGCFSSYGEAALRLHQQEEC